METQGIESIARICVYCAFLALLACASVIDVKRRIIPNWVIFGTVLLWICWSAIRAALQAADDYLTEMLAAMATLVLLLIFTGVAERVFGKYLFGGGDIKLVSTCVLFLGVTKSAIALFLACVASLGYVALKRNGSIPFAPCMLIGVSVVMLV